MSGIMRHNFLPVIVEERRINNGDIKPWRSNLPIGRMFDGKFLRMDI